MFRRLVVLLEEWLCCHQLWSRVSCVAREDADSRFAEERVTFAFSVHPKLMLKARREEDYGPRTRRGTGQCCPPEGSTKVLSGSLG
ncbi:hypothetical protein E2C01_003348 [Portunus trituberculatus]|uniref:Uncharacterized protein n=1 Tax=Portunus trituberculatus TaxID=210409 RepID=A0A5B7CNM4_PORTR|nr:hypothetical protein [Portunus trituberculatus]